MPFPRLKNALLCRILVYVVVIGAFAVPAVIVVKLPFVPDGIGQSNTKRCGNSLPQLASKRDCTDG